MWVHVGVHICPKTILVSVFFIWSTRFWLWGIASGTPRPSERPEWANRKTKKKQALWLWMKYIFQITKSSVSHSYQNNAILQFLPDWHVIIGLCKCGLTIYGMWLCNLTMPKDICFAFQRTHHYDCQIRVPACVYKQISPPSGYQEALFVLILYCTVISLFLTLYWYGMTSYYC